MPLSQTAAGKDSFRTVVRGERVKGRVTILDARGYNRGPAPRPARHDTDPAQELPDE